MVSLKNRKQKNHSKEIQKPLKRKKNKDMGKEKEQGMQENKKRHTNNFRKVEIFKY